MNSNTQKVMYNGIEYNAVVNSSATKAEMVKRMNNRMDPRQAFNLKNEIPSNYTTYQVRAYYTCTVERGFEPTNVPYATNSFIEDADENWQWTDYAQARAVFINALSEDYYRLELVVSDEDDEDCPYIVVEEWARQKKVKVAVPESDDEKHRREYPDHRICECAYCIDCGCCECDIEDQDDFTNRMCENPACKKEFDLSDPHYYDEEESVCYCCEECYKNNV